jgi:hypothetical protein
MHLSRFPVADHQHDLLTKLPPVSEVNSAGLLGHASRSVVRRRVEHTCGDSHTSPMLGWVICRGARCARRASRIQ